MWTMSTTKGVKSCFLRPGYEPPSQTLLTIKAYDCGEEDQVGLHVGTATIACAVVARNAWDGYLITTADPTSRVDPSLLFEPRE